MGRRDDDRDTRSKSLLVRNLRYETETEEVKRFFEKFGDVRDVYLPQDYKSGRPRGFGFIEFYDERDADEALHELDGADLDGNRIEVCVAKDRRKSPGAMRAIKGRGRGGRGGRGGRDRSRSRGRGGYGRRGDDRDRDRDRRRDRSDSRDRRRDRRRDDSRDRRRDDDRDRDRDRERRRDRSDSRDRRRDDSPKRDERSPSRREESPRRERSADSRGSRD